MADPHKAPRTRPPPPTEHHERILSRPADSAFARFPEHEVDHIPVPGAGPHGSVASGLNLPVVVIAAGIVIAFLTFVVQNGWPLAIGLLLIVGGAIWSGLRTPSPGHMQGPGVVEDDGEHH